MEDDELDQSSDDQADENQDEPERSLNELAGAAQAMGHFHRATEVEQFFGDVSTEADLDLPGADEAFAWLDQHGFGYLAEPLRARRDTARDEQRRVQEAEVGSAREREDAEILEQIKRDREQKERDERLAARRRELEDQLDAPEAGGKPKSDAEPDLGPFVVFSPKHPEHDPNQAEPAERKARFDARTRVIDEQQPFLDTISKYENSVIADSGLHVGQSVSERLQAWDSLTPEQQSVAQALGHRAPIDVPIGTEEYQRELEAARAARKQRGEWLAERQKGRSK